MHGFGYGFWGEYGWVGMIINLVIIVGIIGGFFGLIIWAIKQITSQGKQTGSRQGSDYQTPKEILQTRYAQGEITREQYLEILADLQ